MLSTPLESWLRLREQSRNLGRECLAEKTRQACGDEVLLMASYDQIDEMMALMPEDVGLLLDVAHLNVSTQTLSFDRRKPFDHSLPMQGAIIWAITTGSPIRILP